MSFEDNSYAAPQQEQPKTWPTRTIGAVIVAFCIFLILSLLTYNINEMGWSALNPQGHETAAEAPCTNLMGNVGLYLAGITYSLLGAASIYSMILLGTMGVSMIAHPLRTRTGRWIALIVMIICACAFLSMQPWIWTNWAAEMQLEGPGGLLGHFDGTCITEKLLGARWGMVLMVVGHAVALIFFARETPKSIGTSLWDDIQLLSRNIQERRRRKHEERQQQEEDWKNRADNSRQQPQDSQLHGFDDERPLIDNQPQPTPQPTPVQKPVVQPTQLPPRVRPSIQIAPPPVPQHRTEPEKPAEMPAAPRRVPKRDPFDPENREDEERVPDFTPVPAPPRTSLPAPTVRTRTPRPDNSTPKHMSAGDNLLDLMTEVEDEIERRASGENIGNNMPIPRSCMPLSPAAEEAFRRFRGLKDNDDDQEPTPTPAPEPQPEIIPEDTPIDIPPTRTAVTPLQPARPVVTPTPVTPRPQNTPRLQNTPRPPRELPEDTRAMYDDYPLPPYDMLFYKPQAEEDTAAAREEMFATQQNIIETLSSFRIDVEAGDITRGPSITRYEFYPPKGLKLNRITNLADNLKLATQSKSINILAPIPGKNTVGIELENDIKAPVYLRELLQSEAFHSPKLRIPVALGKDVYGNPVIGDLAAMPHTLVAGTTGSGKSVCVNSMILSMLYKFRPDELRLILVDPKVVEMQPYKKLPHLACPVVTNAARVIGALRWAVNEMEHRYKLFSKIGVRNFEDFNNRPEDFEPEPEEEEIAPQYNSLPNGFDAADAIVRDIEDSQGNEYLPEEEEQGEFDFDADEQIPAKLPYIVIIIDELADLMMQVKEDLENYIARLTQKARAAGIHLVAATQTPRANVITGIIKANIPSRLAFKVASPLDSRVILDTNGAENLLGKGDFLFLPPGGVTKMTRAQGAFVSDPEIASIVKFCAAHAKQNFVQGVTAEMNNAENSSGGGMGDGGGRLGGNGMSDEDAELYTHCVNLVIAERKASTSMLQRRFSIGYGRAAKMMDMMEARGVIGPASGNTSRPREVLIDAPE